jgi:4-hydroxy-tetrahydrodipicolinate reductase
MKIALFGASGRMGRAIASAIVREKDLILTEAIVHAHSSSLGKDLGALLEQPPLGIALTMDYQGKANLIIDMALPCAFPSALETALKHRLPIVIGTTGLSSAQMQKLVDTSTLIPVFYSANFSLGMALFRKLSRIASLQYHPECTADLIEIHHAQKKDAPSGSALMLAKDLEKTNKSLRIHSIRSGKIIGEHTLLFNSEEEQIELSHKVHSRSAFAKGALAAARFLIQQKPGLFGMDDLFPTQN